MKATRVAVTVVTLAGMAWAAVATAAMGRADATRQGVGEFTGDSDGSKGNKSGSRGGKVRNGGKGGNEASDVAEEAVEEVA